jgi:hypothetical protein
MTWYEWKFWRLAWAPWGSTADSAMDDDGRWKRVVSGLFVLTWRRHKK